MGLTYCRSVWISIALSVACALSLPASVRAAEPDASDPATFFESVSGESYSEGESGITIVPLDPGFSMPDTYVVWAFSGDNSWEVGLFTQTLSMPVTWATPRTFDVDLEGIYTFSVEVNRRYTCGVFTTLENEEYVFGAIASSFTATGDITGTLGESFGVFQVYEEIAEAEEVIVELGERVETFPIVTVPTGELPQECVDFNNCLTIAKDAYELAISNCADNGVRYFLEGCAGGGGIGAAGGGMLLGPPGALGGAIIGCAAGWMFWSEYNASKCVRDADLILDNAAKNCNTLYGNACRARLANP